MPMIDRLTAREILDSRGCPTVEATCELKSGARGTASVPCGASTGSAEASEVRDRDSKRYGGLGCRKAVRHINEELNRALGGNDLATQRDLDHRMVELDGTPNKGRLGANALLAVSLAYARAAARERNLPLFQYFAELLGKFPRCLPRPTINLFSGGKHAGGQVEIQDVMVVPLGAGSMETALEMTHAIYQGAVELGRRKYGARPLTADEGGLAPPFPGPEAMLEDTLQSITAAGLEPGRDVAIAIDLAASHFFRKGRYHLGGQALDSSAMIEHIAGWLQRAPIISIEDGLAEEDWEGWPKLLRKLAGRALVLGDDLLCTNARRIERAIAARAANALLLKVNQVGTVTEALESCRLARAAGWKVSISARSGETEDDWLADLAVGWSGDYVKIGSITHCERLAKYNRLLAIESLTGLSLPG
ncbi:phosphopyruvate hydratase [Acidobacteria bacterium AH-259-G07]|nr:phosphopyruvate hydratase [Acidobacteria bacterium AH-259-G07]